MIIGAPPIGRWNFLDIAKREARAAADDACSQPKQTFELVGLMPTIRTQGGVVDRGQRAGEGDGVRLRLHERTRARVASIARADSAASSTCASRIARSELGLLELNLRPIVFAPGETEVTTPEEHSFRYAMVFARGCASAEVVK